MLIRNIPVVDKIMINTIMILPEKSIIREIKTTVKGKKTANRKVLDALN